MTSGSPDKPSSVVISKTLLAINSGSSLATHLLNITVLVWLQQYLITRVPDAEYSLYPVLLAPLSLVPLISSISTSGLGRFVVQAYARGDEQGVTRIISSIFPPVLLTSIGLIVAGGVFAWHVDAVLTVDPALVTDARLMMSLMVLGAAFRIFCVPFQLGFFVRQRFVLQNLLRVFMQMLRAALLLLLLFGVGPRVLWVVVASVAAEIVTLIINVAVSLRLVPSLRVRWSLFDLGLMGEIAGFGAWSMVIQLAGVIRTSADPLILNKLGTPFDVTCFYLGSLVFTQTRRLILLVLQPLRPVINALYVNDDQAGLQASYLRGGRLGLWGVMLIATPMLVYHEQITTLYVGDTYATAGVVMVMLLLILPFNVGHRLMPEIANAGGQVSRFAIRTTLCQLMNLGLTLYLVGVADWGALGSAAASLTIAAIVQPLVMWRFGLGLVNLSLREWAVETFARGMGPAAIMALALWLLEATVAPRDWWTLAVCVLIGMVVYMAALLTACMTSADRRDGRFALTAVGLGGLAGRLGW